METKFKFEPKIYIEQLRRCFIESEQHLKLALDADLEINDLQQLCRHFNCSAAGIVQAVAKELKI